METDDKKTQREHKNMPSTKWKNIQIDTALIIGFNGLFFALFAWFSSIQFNNIQNQFNNIQNQFDDLRNDNREIRNQVYNHIPTQIRELEKAGQERDKKIEQILQKLDQKNN